MHLNKYLYLRHINAKKIEMKKIIAIIVLMSISLFAFVQNINDERFKALWKEVDEAEQKDLPKSALKIVEEIYQLATAEKNDHEQMKAITYKAKLLVQASEDGNLQAIDFLEKHAETLSGTNKYVNYFLIGAMYQNYYQRNKWNIDSRSDISDSATEQASRLEFYDRNEFYKLIIKNYKLALNNNLKDVDASNFEDFFEDDKSVSFFFPTLYDKLEYSIVKQLSKLESYTRTNLDNKFFCNADNFLSIEIENSDEQPEMAALYFFQQMMKENKSNINTFVFSDFERISFLDTHQSGKDDCIMELLTEISDKHAENEAVIFINDKIAGQLSVKSSEGKTEAINLLKKTISKFPESKFISRCKNRYNQLIFPSISISTDEIAYPGENFPILIKYENTSTTNIKIVKVSDRASAEHGFYANSKELEKLYQQKPISEKALSLPEAGDNSEHSTYYVEKGLNPGFYLIFADVADSSQNGLKYSELKVSRLSLLKINERKYMVVDRNSGKPVESAKVKITYRQNGKIVTLSSAETSSDGIFELTKLDNNRYYSDLGALISKGDDEIFFGINIYGYGSYYESHHNVQSKLFTDRAIYRPGQTVYFKGIVFEGNDNLFHVMPNDTVTVTAKDANYKEFYRKQLVTNQFGSINDSIKIQENVLPGNFYIEIRTNNVSKSTTFKVEEYKRPTFEITMDKITEEVKFGDTITITGNAKSYSGVPVSDANVNFNVRCSSYSYYWWWSGNKEEKHLADGSVKTDDDGNFSLSFVAKECFSQINIYDIDAVVADINGESHTASSSFMISHQSMWLSSDVKSLVDFADFNGMNAYANNISGDKINATISVTIEKLEEPTKETAPMRQTADRKMYTYEEWQNLCPNLEYDGENSLQKRKVTATVFKGTINTADTTWISFGKKFATGSYKLTLKSKDKDGNEISDEKYFQIGDKSSKKMPFVKTDLFEVSETTAKIGDKIDFRVGSSFNNVTVLYTIQIANKPLDIKSLSLSNEIKTISIPVTEDCYGDIGITAIFVRNGKCYNYKQTIYVPRENKKLDVDFITFRDKTTPGAEESWQLKITDKSGKAADAELLTTIYDASLDSYVSHSLRMWPYSSYNLKDNFSANGFGFCADSWIKYINPKNSYVLTPYPNPYFFDCLNVYYTSYDRRYKEVCFSAVERTGAAVQDESLELNDIQMAAGAVNMDMDFEEESVPGPTEEAEAFANAEVRTNFNETAFFCPDLTTDKEGNIFVKFTMPESLTRWNILGIAHTKDMQIGDFEKTMVTQKKVSITPNWPRFLREGDEMYFSAKIANLTENTINGKARIEITNAENSKNITSLFLTNNTLNFTADAGKNVSVDWKLSVPMSIGAVSIRVVAIGDGHSDGEEKVLPILSNRMMVTETMPLPVRRAGTTRFSFDAMKQNKSNTLENYSYTLEFTPNPAWYAVLALPYMMEYPYECAEQTFSRIYSNLLASHVANSDKKIKEMFERWKATDAKALASNLQRNEELKSVVIENSPWLLDAESEAESKQNIGNLFDLARIESETAMATKKLAKMQKSNGGWPWFDGMPENLYVTQHIVGNYGHLKRLGIKFPDDSMEKMIRKAIGFIDSEIVRLYEQQKKDKNIYLGYTQIHYLYVRSFFIKEKPMNKTTQNVFDIYMKLAEKEWTKSSFYMRGMLALAMNRSGHTKTAKDIVASLKEYAQHSEELGMYWNLERGYYWYNNGVETQSLLIELFEEMGEKSDVNEMKVWLLKQKQTSNWKTTKATAEAVYALLLDGTTILTETDYPKISIGNKQIDLAKEKTEDGTGYFKQTWKKNEISGTWSDVSVQKADSTVAWGGVYWQYFEDIDNIKGFEDTPLKIRKSLFVNRVEKGKEVIVPISQKNAKLHVGDKVTVRIEIEVDRNMEYIHLKDMRAAAFEPTEKLSGYRFKHALGYYQAIKDASMNFFIDYLPKGTYVFEYEVLATQKGTFSNGITTIQSMYAPEYTSHSNGIRVTVE